ncbi:hypothetical protein ACIQU4_26195 [Streptomyces sp. NPDC090741]|uniref:hypothetical protein n=1 Tax=Streptomyces sp. NPDC090741 TaxID=3365967 RepID=UPI00382CCB68
MPPTDTATAPLAAPPAPRGVIRRLQSRHGRDNPFPFFEEIRSAGPVVSLGSYALLVTGHTKCFQILTDRVWHVPDHTWRATRGLDTDGLSAKILRTLPRLNPPVHGQMRRLQPGPFTPAALERLRPVVRRLVRIHLDRLDAELTEHGRADFVATVARTLPIAVMCEIRPACGPGRRSSGPCADPRAVRTHREEPPLDHGLTITADGCPFSP